MKALLTLTLTIFALAPALAARGGNIEKQFDGKFGRCQAEADVGHHAYLPSDLVAQADASTLSVAFVLHHYECGQSRGDFDWETSLRPMDPYGDRDLDGNPILIKLSQVQAVLARSGDAGTLSVIEVENAPQQTITFATTPAELLSAAQLNALAGGAPVEARATFFIRSNVSVVTSTGETVQLGQRGGGAYTIFLTLQQNRAGQLQVLGVQAK
jgi:hypothetical protein